MLQRPAEVMSFLEIQVQQAELELQRTRPPESEARLAAAPPKAMPDDLTGRFREIISDPLNLLIERVPQAGTVRAGTVCLHNGHWVPLSGEGSYYGDFSQILMLNRGVHEPLEEYVFQEVLKALPAAPAMLELGAYWGHYSMWLKLGRPQGSTILVEPDRTALAAGRANFASNGYEGEFIAAMVGQGAFEVDAFLRSRSLPHLDILHSDIQGYEAQMLAGAAGTLTGTKVDYLFVSTHSQALHRHVIGTLVAHGYRVEVSSDFENETTSFDGFVFASSPRKAPVFKGFAPLGRQEIVTSDAARLLASLQSATAPAP